MQTRLLLAFALIIASASAWMDPSWQYRTPVTVSNGGSAQTDYQVSVTLNTNALILAGKMRSDCGDLRFANSTDNSLPYWVETGTCNTASTKAWVRLPYVPGGSSTIYAYYGNAGASGASSGTATFPFFDDFNRANGAVGNGWTEYHSGGNAVYSIVSNVLHVTDSTGYNEWISKPASVPSDFALEMNVLSFPSPSNDAEIITGVGGTLFNWLSLDNYPQGSNTRINGVYQNLGGLTTGRWKITKIGTAWRFYNGLDQNRGSYTKDIGTPTTMYIASFGSSESFDIDDFRVRKYASVEPTTSLQAEQARPTVIFAGISPSSIASYPSTQQNFTLWIYSNQTSADNIALSCTGTCYYSENPVAVSAQQNKSVTVTIPAASVSGTTNYQITAVSQANYLNNATASFSITVDATTWRSQWTDAFGNDYAYRAPITISNNGSALTDYQVPVNLANLIYNSSGLVGSWHFSENGGTRFADSSGNGNDATYAGETLNNGTLTGFAFNANSGWTSGKYGAALKFNGLNYVNLGNATSLRAPNGYTLMAWIYPTTTAPTYQGIVTKRYLGSETTNYAMRLNGGKLATYYYSAGWHQFVSNSTVIYPNNWYLVAVSYSSGDAGSARLYVNGAQVDGSWNVGNGTQGLVTGTGYVLLGSSDGSENFSGTMDDVRIYNRALSPAEVAQVYQNSTFLRDGLAGYWRLDEGAGTSAYDTHHVATQDNRDGAKAGNALSFDGINDYASAPDSASLNLTGALTISIWVKTLPGAQGPTYALLAGKWSNVYKGYMLWRHSYGGRVYFYLDDVSVASNSQFNDGNWHNLAGVYNGSTMAVYFDGVKENEIARSGAFNQTNVPFLIGTSQDFTQWFNGTIDEVRVYNRALSPQEIAALYGAGKLKLDYSDLRFANSSISSIPYWIESDSRAWVRVPYVPSGTSTIYAYYGSPTAQSAGNGNATFDFFDDFEDGTYAGKWSNTYGTLAETGGYLDYIGLSGYWTSARANYAVPSTAWVMETSARVTVQSSAEYATVGQTGPDNSGASRPGPQVGAGQLYGLANFYLETATATSVYTDTQIGTLGYNTWYASPRIIELRKASGNAQAKVYDGNRNQLASATSTTNVPDSTNPFGIYAAAEGSGLHTRLYWFLVRKYASPEPSGALLLEESANPAAILSVSPASKTTYPDYNETFSLWAYNNQTGPDTFALSCAGTCSVSPALLALTPYQNVSANVTITSANVSGTTTYTITATSQANASNAVSTTASLTVDVTRWRSNWADAYNRDFKYKVPIAINNSGSALADYQVNLTIDTASAIGLARMRSDCGDLRITNGTNEMPYWIESGCNSTSTKIWARVPYVPAGSSTVYAYYGSPGAAGTGSGDATFELFDAFDGAALNTTKWAGDTGRASVGGGVMTFAAASSDGVLRSTVAFPPQSAMRIRNSIASGSWSTFGFQIYPYASPYQRVLGYKDVSYNSAVFQDATEVIVNTNWTIGSYTVKDIGWYDAGNIARWYEGGSEMQGSPYTNGANIPDESLVAVPARGAYQAHYVDWVLVRKYRSPEPASLSGAEQSKGYRTLVRRCGLAQANATVTAYQAGNITGSCVSDQNGICTLEIGAGIYDLQFLFADNSAAWKNGTVFS